MTQTDGDLLKSLEIARIELSARLRDRCDNPQLWADTVSSAVLALAAVKDRLQALLSKEADSNRKLSSAEYAQRSAKEFEAIKYGYEQRLKDLLQQATEDRVAASHALSVAYQQIELERDELRRYQEQLDAREQELGARSTELDARRTDVQGAFERLTTKNRAADECYQRMKVLQEQAEFDREQARVALANVNAEFQSQQIKTTEIEESCRHYRERLKEAENIKAQAVALRQQEADYLNSLSKKIQDYENRLYLVNKREKFVMDKWDETCRQVAHLKLPVDVQGMPVP